MILVAEPRDIPIPRSAGTGGATAMSFAVRRGNSATRAMERSNSPWIVAGHSLDLSRVSSWISNSPSPVGLKNERSGKNSRRIVV